LVPAYERRSGFAEIQADVREIAPEEEGRRRVSLVVKMGPRRGHLTRRKVDRHRPLPIFGF